MGSDTNGAPARPRHRLVYHEISGDGNCLFSAIAEADGGTYGTHVDYRQLAVEQLHAFLSCWASRFGTTGEWMTDYIDQMSRLSEYGDDIASSALVERLNVRIVVVQSNGNQRVPPT